MNLHFLHRSAAVALIAFCSVFAAQAHGGHAGDIEITHPFATPTPAGAVNGAAYIVSLKNGGAQPDKLVKASTPAAERTEIHSMSVDNGGVMRMRQVDGIDLPPGSTVTMKPGDGYHFMLIGVKQPLKDGDTFPMTLEFARAGKTEVKIVVQVPKPHAGAKEGMDGMVGHTH